MLTSSLPQLLPVPKRITLWTTADVLEWLEHNNLQELHKYFNKHKITGRKLLALGPADVASITEEPYLTKRFKTCLMGQWNQVRGVLIVARVI